MVAGLVDFYLWEYDYGHDLNPKAAIKIPGMSYQPPLIGSKQLLNMRTSSWPHVGGWAIGISAILGLLASTVLSKNKEKKKTNFDNE
jgi:copper chaperone NosL